MAMTTSRCVPFEVCGALVEEAIREALSARFFKGTVEEVLAVARGKVEQLRVDLVEADDGTRSPHNCPAALADESGGG